jgi:hypothetical protein
VITVVTPVHVDRGEFMWDAWLSVRAQTGFGVPIEWVIQVDGVGDLGWYERFLRAVGPGARAAGVRVRPSVTGRQFGTAVTSAVAMARAQGEFVCALGGDDVLVPGVLPRLRTLLADRPDLSWVAGGHARSGNAPALAVPAEGAPDEVRDVIAGMPGEGPWWLCPPLMASGVTDPGAVGNWWERQGVFPVLGTTVLYRRCAVQEAGGYPAVPTGEDAALLVRVSDRFAGLMTDVPVLVYRQHAGQNTRQDWWTDLRSAAHVIIRAGRVHEVEQVPGRVAA